jgi:hypothetical protein
MFASREYRDVVIVRRGVLASRVSWRFFLLLGYCREEPPEGGSFNFQVTKD